LVPKMQKSIRDPRIEAPTPPQEEKPKPIKFYYIIAGVEPENVAATINDEVKKENSREFVNVLPPTVVGASPTYVLLFNMELPEGEYPSQLPGAGSPSR
jgi:hypothetical protein